MAFLKAIKNRFLRLFRRNHPANPQPVEHSERQNKYPKGIDRETEELRRKLKQFLITTTVRSGTVVEQESFRLIKSSPGLYRLEGRQQQGKPYSLVITTGNHIREQADKITGFLQVNEAELNRAIQEDHNSLGQIMEYFASHEIKDSTTLGLSQETFQWQEVQKWPRFWREQLLLKLSANDTALLLISLGDEFKQFFSRTATRKQRRIVMDELFFLNQGVTDRQMNPHSKNRSWIDFDFAEQNLMSNINRLKQKMQQEESA